LGRALRPPTRATGEETATAYIFDKRVGGVEVLCG
jgi:hypothetical protein